MEARNYNLMNWKERRDCRNEYVNHQDGLCCHCKKPLKEDADEKILSMPINKKLFPKNFFEWPVHLHHNHDTGMTIGAVHNICNAVLWQYHGE